MSLDPLSEDIFISIADKEILLDPFVGTNYGWKKMDGVEQIILAPKWEMEKLGSQVFKARFIWVPSIDVGN